MWILLSLAAGALQTMRNAASRRLSHALDPALNSWARFAFNLPCCLLVVGGLAAFLPMPQPTLTFLGVCGVAAASQLLASVALLSAFRHTNFSASIVLHKLEVPMTAVVGTLVFSEQPSAVGWLGIAACAVGTVWMNLLQGSKPRSLRKALHFDRGALLPLTSAALLVVASFAVKRAVGRLADDNPGLAGGSPWLALHTLLHVTWMEVVMLTVPLWLRAPGAFALVPKHAGAMALVGATAFASSLCWYAAFAQGIVAYVRALGQIEAVLAVALGLALFRERETVRQLPATALLVLGMLAVLLSG